MQASCERYEALEILLKVFGYRGIYREEVLEDLDVSTKARNGGAYQIFRRNSRRILYEKRGGATPSKRLDRLKELRSFVSAVEHRK